MLTAVLPSSFFRFRDLRFCWGVLLTVIVLPPTEMSCCDPGAGCPMLPCWFVFPPGDEGDPLLSTRPRALVNRQHPPRFQVTSSLVTSLLPQLKLGNLLLLLVYPDPLGQTRRIGPSPPLPLLVTARTFGGLSWFPGVNLSFFPGIKKVGLPRGAGYPQTDHLFQGLVTARPLRPVHSDFDTFIGLETL